MRSMVLFTILVTAACVTSGCMQDGRTAMVPAVTPESGTSGSGNTFGSRAIAIAVNGNESLTGSDRAQERFLAGLRLSTQYGQYNDSLALFDEAIALDPSFSGAWTAKAVALHNLKRFDEALRCYDRALELAPGDTTVWRLKEMTLEDLGRSAESSEYHSRATAPATTEISP